MEFRPEHYVLQDGTSDCFICIFEEDPGSDLMILGNGFLRGFYTTHDLETNKFGFASHAKSNKTDPRHGETPDIYLKGTEP